jgi:hypothetical protein
VTLTHIDLHGRVAEVPQSEGGVFRGGDSQVVCGVCAHICQLLVMSCHKEYRALQSGDHTKYLQNFTT